MVNSGELRSIADIYKPNFYNVLMQETGSLKTTKKILESIMIHREVSLSDFIGGFDIEHVGTKVIRSVVNHGINTLEMLRRSTVRDLSFVSGIGESIASCIIKGINEMQREMDEVLRAGVTIRKDKTDGKFKGKTACFTGSFSFNPTKKLESMFLAVGGIVARKMSKNCVFLVSNDKNSDSAKTVMAKKFGIPIINETEYIQILLG